MSDVLTHKCPNCDGPLLFNPSDQNFHCEYCLSVFSEEEIALFEAAPPTDSIKETTATTETQETDKALSEMDLFSCPSCGAEIVTDATTAATFCFYCHNPVVLQGRISGEFLPERVLPFAFEKEEAVTQFLNWANQQRFIPKDFFNEAQIEKLTGVYFPYWTVDADLTGSLRANATKVRVWRAGNYEYTQTAKYRVGREGKLSFKHFIKNALRKNVPVKIVESVQPFPLEKAIPFKSQYLAGFQAEKRDLELADIQQEINQQLKHYGEQLLSDSVSGYTAVYNQQGKLSIKNQRANYVLLPVWLLTYQNQQGTDDATKLYYYAMNGHSGKISGKLPIDRKKLLLFSGAIGLGLLILVLIGGYLI